MLRETVFYHDFNCPHYDSFGSWSCGPAPKKGGIVTIADFSEEFYVDARVVGASLRRPYKPGDEKGKPSGESQPYYRLKPDMDTLVYDGEPDYQKPPDFRAATEAGREIEERHPSKATAKE